MADISVYLFSPAESMQQFLIDLESLAISVYMILWFFINQQYILQDLIKKKILFFLSDTTFFFSISKKNCQKSDFAEKVKILG